MTLRPHLPPAAAPASSDVQQLGHVVVGDRHPLGHTGGARGVDEVGDVIGGRRRQRGAGLAVNAGSLTSMTSRSHPSSRVGQPRGGDRGDRRGIGEHEPDPRRRQRRVDRQIRRPGLEHRQNRHDRLSRPGKQQRHTLPRAHTLAGQQVRQPVRGLIKLAIGPRSGPRRSPPPPPGCAPPARRTTPESTPAVAGWVNTARLPHPSSRACSPASSRSTDDNRRVGSAVIATNTRSNRPAKSRTSKFENGCPAPAVLRKSSITDSNRRTAQTDPRGQNVVKVADAAAPARSRVSVAGMKLTITPIRRLPGAAESHLALKDVHRKPLMLQRFPYSRVDMFTEIGNRRSRRSLQHQRHNPGNHPGKRL